jgi:hypothetical protein
MMEQAVSGVPEAFYQVVLCECACGNRVAFPVESEAEAKGFVCDECYISYQFQDDSRPSRMGLGDGSEKFWPIGILVFSMIRSNQELGEDVFCSWFDAPPPPEDEVPRTGTDG